LTFILQFIKEIVIYWLRYSVADNTCYVMYRIQRLTIII